MSDYCYSLNGEQYEGDLTELLDDHIANGCDERDFAQWQEVGVYRGEPEHPTAEMLFPWPADMLIEVAQENLEDLCGEAADGQLYLSSEKTAELDALLKATIWKFLEDNNLKPTCYGVKNVKKITVRCVMDSSKEILIEGIDDEQD